MSEYAGQCFECGKNAEILFEIHYGDDVHSVCRDCFDEIAEDWDADAFLEPIDELAPCRHKWREVGLNLCQCSLCGETRFC